MECRKDNPAVDKQQHPLQWVWSSRPSALGPQFADLEYWDLQQLHKKDMVSASPSPLSSFHAIPPKEVSSSLRLVQWNVNAISYGPLLTCGTAAARALKLAELLLGLDPDVIVLQEFGSRSGARDLSVSGDDSYGVLTLARGLESAGFALSLCRNEFPTLVASKLPVCSIPEYLPLGHHRGALRVVVATARGPVTIVGTHLDHEDGSKRLSEMTKLLTHVGDQQTPVLIAGDMNQPRSCDYTALEWSYISSNHSKRGSSISDGVSSLLSNSNFKCCFDFPLAGCNWQAGDPPPPTHWTATNIDHCYGRGAACEAVWVLPTLFSDHLPVVSDWTITGPQEKDLPTPAVVLQDSAVEGLLTTQCVGEQLYRPPSSSLTHFRFAEIAEAPASFSVASSSHFSSHLTLRLPDLPPLHAAPPFTLVHVFDMKSDLHTSVLEPLLSTCLLLERVELARGPVVVSNVGGFHSSVRKLFDYCTPDNGADRQQRSDLPADECFKPLHTLLMEALDIVLRGGGVNKEYKAEEELVKDDSTTPPPPPVPASSACHPSGSTHFSKGDAITPPPPPAPASSASAHSSSFSNCLLLRSQLRRFSHEYGFTSITPRAGRIVIFPGYVPHCVCPRNPSFISSSLACPPRVSIACNLSKQASNGDREVTGWANVSRDRAAFNRLHDHGDEELAIVIYLSDGESDSKAASSDLGVDLDNP